MFEDMDLILSLSQQDGDSSDDDGSEHGSPHTSPPHRGHNQHHRRKQDKKKRRWGRGEVLTVKVRALGMSYCLRVSGCVCMTSSLNMNLYYVQGHLIFLCISREILLHTTSDWLGCGQLWCEVMAGVEIVVFRFGSLRCFSSTHCMLFI